MPECDNCGGHVTKRFARVFSRGNAIRGCPECKPFSEIQEGV